MKGDVFKFLSGAAAAAAVGHAGYALAITNDVISVPIFRGREWGVGNLMIEAAVWAVLAIALGYLGWRSRDASTR